jgi:hypothetical protein
MADAPYLVALALVEQQGRRSLPLIGRSLPAATAADADPGETGCTLALSLLLRLWQRSDEVPLRRAIGPDSLLLLEMPLAEMTERLPGLKASWIAAGDTEALRRGLQDLASRGWRISIAKYEPIRFSEWC